MLLQSLKKKTKEDPNNKRKLWDSDDEETSSEEDFHYLAKRLKEDNGKLDDETMRLLRGVI